MEKGRIIAEGSLQDLLEQSPGFRELWRHQEHSE
jgi:ABC-type multidrug transport system fused ATPase/permease subunit